MAEVIFSDVIEYFLSVVLISLSIEKLDGRIPQ